MSLRPEHNIICDWINPDSRVLDLGCGDGSLLHYLSQTQGVTGFGLEIDDTKIVKCIQANVNVIQMDLNAGLSDFHDDSFDYVVMSQTLQAVQDPSQLLHEMLRVGKEGIVTFSNYGHWKPRLQIALGGHMPLTATLPVWHQTPYIRLCTTKDFEDLCKEEGIHIIQRTVVDHAHHTNLAMRMFPTLLGEIALYRFKRRD